MADDLITTADLARQLGVTTRTIARWVEAGKLTYVHKLDGLRGAYLFAPDQAEKLRAAEMPS